ncbi:MAG: DUF4493 domain-containing protein [Candidatus Cryptobacteroides sp.]
MKTNRLFFNGCLGAFIALLPVLASCNGKEGSDSRGRVAFTVNSQNAVTDFTRSQVSDYTTVPSGNDFRLVITDSKEKTIYDGLLKDFPSGMEFGIGNYTAQASYGSVTDEGFDKPCFRGSQSFSITGNGTKEVTINVTLANAIVRVECSDIFRKYYTPYTFTLKTGNGNVISFPKSETRAAFLDAYTLTVEGTLTNQAGKESTFSKVYSTPLAEATCHTLKFDASNIGGTSITITLDNTTEEVDLGEIELNR